jgi:hypothetical protein
VARTHARIYGAIWQDPDFAALKAHAQRAYILAVSQPSVSFCGVVPYTPRRWAVMAADTTPTGVSRSVGELEEAGFVVTDLNTEELLVRSFIRHDGVLESPNLVKALWSDVRQVFSPLLRQAVLWEIPDEFWEGEWEPFAEGFAKPDENPIAKACPTPTPSPTPRSRATRIPDEFFVTADMQEWVERKSSTINWRHHTEKFVNYWKSVPGRKGVKLDWERTWRVWMLKEIGG